MNEAIIAPAGDSMGAVAVGLAGSPFFGEICDWGISAIRAAQGAGNPALETIARAFTIIGEPVAYVLYLIVFLWCVDERRGLRLGIGLLVSNGVNAAVKQTLQIPRPFIREPGINLIPETGYSFPSGHSQNSAAFWPVLASFAGRRSLRWAIAALPILIGISRVYLGVHYPTDVLAGWLLGYAVSAVSVLAVPRVSRAFSDRFPGGITPRARRWALILPTVAAVYLVNEFSSGDGTAGGLLLGFAVGAILLDEANRAAARTEAANGDAQPGEARPGAGGSFSASSGTLAQKALRAAVGFAGLILIYVVLKRAFPAPGSAQYGLFRFVRYALIGLWGSWGAPMTFVRLGLSGNGR